MRASCTRFTTILSTRSHAAVRAIGNASIAYPGLTPVPTTATRLRFAQTSIRVARRRVRRVGYDSSSVVETMAVFDRRIVSIWGITATRDELVHSTATCGFAFLSDDARS